MTALAIAWWLMVAMTTPPCDGPAQGRAPDPRCLEPLDGRPAREASGAELAGRAALEVPRLAALAVVWPVVKTMDVVESNHVIEWARAVLTTDDGLVGVRPELQYSTSFLPTGGVRLFYRRLPGPGTELLARVRTAGPAVMFGQLGLRGSEWSHLSFVVTADRRSDRLFAGIGAFSEGELAAAGRGLARYASDNLGAEVVWSRALRGPFVLAFHGDVQRRDYRATGVKGGTSISRVFGLPPEQCAGTTPSCVDDVLVPGFDEGLRIAHAGGAAAVNLRGTSRDASGVSAVVDATLASGLAGDRSRHATIVAETVLAWGGRDKVLLLRGRAASIENLSGRAVPFEELVRPGGAAGMRGFPEGRFRGESGVVGTAEYRWYISTYLDATLFTDVGTVAGPRFAGLRDSRWFPSFGAGVRLYRPQETYWDVQAQSGLEVAYAPDGGLRVLFALASF